MFQFEFKLPIVGDICLSSVEEMDESVDRQIGCSRWFALIRGGACVIWLFIAWAWFDSLRSSVRLESSRSRVILNHHKGAVEIDCLTSGARLETRPSIGLWVWNEPFARLERNYSSEFLFARPKLIWRSPYIGSAVSHYLVSIPYWLLFLAWPVIVLAALVFIKRAIVLYYGTFRQ